MEQSMEQAPSARDALAEMLRNKVGVEKQQEIIINLVNSEGNERERLAEDFANEVGIDPEVLLRAAAEEEENPTLLEEAAA